MEVKFKKLSSAAVIPSAAHPAEDAGLDMTCTAIGDNDYYISYFTDIAVEIPKGYVGLLFPRSSNCTKDLLLSNSVGVVDSGYRGGIEFRFKKILNPNRVINGDYNTMVYKIGDKVGQLVIIPYPQIEPIEVDELSESNRGTSGYGSSGN